MIVEYQHKGIGWYCDKENDRLIFRGEEALSADNSLVSFYTGEFDITTHGNIDDFRTDYNATIKNNIPLEFGVVAGLTGCLVGFLSTTSHDIEIPSIVFDIHGRSTTGKTTWAKLAVSMGGLPKKSHQKISLAGTCSTTVNALFRTLSSNYGYALLYDELARLGNYLDLAGMIYSLAEGTDKARMNGKGELVAPQHWATSVLFTGEHSLLSKANKADGLQMRVLPFDNVQWTTSAEQAHEVELFSVKHAGLPIMCFAEYLLSLTPSDVADEYKKEVQKIEPMIPLAQCYQERVAKSVAIITVTAKLASEALGIELHEQEILDFVLNNIGENTVEGEAASAYDYIVSKYHNHASKFGDPPKHHFSRSENILIKNCDCWGYIRRDYQRMTDGGTKVSADLLVISANIFKRWLKDGGFDNEDNILRKWRDDGLIKIQKPKHFYSRLLLQTGGTPMKCLQIVLADTTISSAKNDTDTLADYFKEKICDVKNEKIFDKKTTELKAAKIENAVEKLLGGEFDKSKLDEIFKECFKIKFDVDKLLELADDAPVEETLIDKETQKQRMVNLLADDEGDIPIMEGGENDDDI